jgi:hypothetical protein
MRGTPARWAPKRNTRHVRKLGGPTQRKARPQVGYPNARLHIRNLVAPTQHKARPQVGQRNARQSARCAPKRKTHPQRKRPHKGELGKKMSWRMEKNKFCLGGRLFNTASPRLGSPTEGTSATSKRKTRPEDVRTSQVGRPNATQGTSARGSPKRKTDPQRKRPHKGALG